MKSASMAKYFIALFKIEQIIEIVFNFNVSSSANDPYFCIFHNKLIAHQSKIKRKKKKSYINFKKTNWKTYRNFPF